MLNAYLTYMHSVKILFSQIIFSKFVQIYLKPLFSGSNAFISMKLCCFVSKIQKRPISYKQKTISESGQTLGLCLPKCGVIAGGGKCDTYGYEAFYLIKHSFSFYLTKRPFSNNPIFCPEGGGDNIEQESIFQKKALEAS